jgi:putative endonuclease
VAARLSVASNRGEACSAASERAVEKLAFVYILASRRNGTLYVGVTSQLQKRIWQHKTGTIDGFTKRYGVKALVWFEACDSIEAAIVREKQLKFWKRTWKLDLIEQANPEWRDLYDELDV